tara:strand:+ start:2271 stop:2372 length:102 start_codon:yes stop_codon:yes gene_type:complete
MELEDYSGLVIYIKEGFTLPNGTKKDGKKYDFT